MRYPIGTFSFKMQLFQLFAALLGICLIESCTTSTANTTNATHVAKGTATKQEVQHSVAATTGITTTLHNVYLSKAEFEQLFKPLPNSYSRMVFQFYFPPESESFDNSPTLAVWPSKKNGNGFDYTAKPQILHYAGVSFVPTPTDVFLGDQQLDKKLITDAISAHPACQDKCVLLFAPVADLHMYYTIFLVEDSTTISLHSLDKNSLTAISPIGTTNPSPPASTR